jgi:phosphate starvation-inducible PhoH-like protein
MESYMAKRARKQNNKGNYNDMVVELNTYRKKQITILPRNVHQEDYIDLLNDPQKSIVFATGPAGTGKTMLAVQMGIQKFISNEVSKIVVTRPAVSVDEQHGFLPGDLKDKMAPWTRPIFDVLEEYWTPQQVERMIENKEIEIAPLAYMRGRTFKECWIVADEMQNATPEQMKMLLTRIGDNSKIVVTGDLAQHDRGFQNNGLKDFTQRLTDNHNTIGCVHFTKQDVERHPAVVDVLNIYGE